MIEVKGKVDHLKNRIFTDHSYLSNFKALLTLLEKDEALTTILSMIELINYLVTLIFELVQTLKEGNMDNRDSKIITSQFRIFMELVTSSPLL